MALFAKMPKDFTQDVVAIRQWLAKEPYLPNDLDDLMIKKFLHSCYGSLEQTKKCIEKFFVTRSVMSELYTGRDPLSPRMKTAFAITNVGEYAIHDNQDLLIHQLDDPTLENFSFYDILKCFTIVGDVWLKEHPTLAEGHVIIMDIKDYTMKLLPKVNIMFFRDFLLFLLEAMPVRLKQIHVINHPPYVDKLFALVKPVLPNEICDLIHFHLTSESLHQFINKKYLPKEYGGEAENMKPRMQAWVKRAEEMREWFRNDNVWKADLKKKPKSSVEDNYMSGSFRTLAID